MLVYTTIFDTLSSLMGQFGEQLLGSPLIIGILVFMFIMFFALVCLVPFEALVVIMIPTCFLVAVWIPMLQWICALLIGLTIGIGILKWIRK
jgi:hypothetical protein